MGINHWILSLIIILHIGLWLAWRADFSVKLLSFDVWINHLFTQWVVENRKEGS